MKLQIPKNLPQFSDSASLFISSGEYESHFYLAHQGILEELESFKMPPREEARKKQRSIAASRGKDPGVVSRRKAYIEDLKKKFQARVGYTIHGLMDEYQFRSIYLFAPEPVAKRIVNGLEPSEEEKIKIKFFGEYTKLHPLKMIRMFWEKIGILISASIAPPTSLEIKKIIDRRIIRHPAIQKIKGT
ncbi:MAG: hypothetical protein AAB487_03405 [Patescibacteria group bacterium]